MSPTQRTLDECRRREWLADIVERWIPCGGAHGIRKDFLGLGDVLCFPGDRPLLIQCCSASSCAAHERKLRAATHLADWLQHGRLEVWAWRKYSKPKDGRWWRPRVVAIESGTPGSGSKAR